MELNKKLFYSFLFLLLNHSFILLRRPRYPFFLILYSLNHEKKNHCNCLTKNFFIGVLIKIYGFYHIIVAFKFLFL